MTRPIKTLRGDSTYLGSCVICSREDPHKVTAISVPISVIGGAVMKVCDRCAPHMAREFIRTGSHLRGTDNVGGPDR